MKNAIEQYRQLRRRVEKDSEALSKLHADNIVCAAGCCDCCTNLSVFPVEFYSLLETLKANNQTKLSFNEDLPCGFLKNSLCSIYQSRPLICMSHGIPIVFLNDELEELQYSVSFCEKNFTHADLDEIEFDSSNTLNIDELNSELSQINCDFVNKRKEEGLDTPERIELRRLLDFL